VNRVSNLFLVGCSFFFKWKVRNYTETGFLKIKAPDAVFSIIKEFWEQNKDSQINEWSHATPYHNIWEAPTSVIRIDNSSLIGGGNHLYTSIASAARAAMEVRQSRANNRNIVLKANRLIILLVCFLYIIGMDWTAAVLNIGVRYPYLSQSKCIDSTCRSITTSELRNH
jgi:hypothetical protein